MRSTTQTQYPLQVIFIQSLILTQATPPLMFRTASTPMDLSQTFQAITIEPPEPPIPSALQPNPTLLRPKPRKPVPPPPPSLQLQVPPYRQGRTPGRSRRRAYSRLSDSGWLTDEIVGGQVDDFDFESNLTKFDKRRDWEEFRVLLA